MRRCPVMVHAVYVTPHAYVMLAQSSEALTQLSLFAPPPPPSLSLIEAERGKGERNGASESEREREKQTAQCLGGLHEHRGHRLH
jgi:hypothetical protein